VRHNATEGTAMICKLRLDACVAPTRMALGRTVEVGRRCLPTEAAAVRAILNDGTEPIVATESNDGCPDQCS
jgi:hypothetical protein